MNTTGTTGRPALPVVPVRSGRVAGAADRNRQRPAVLVGHGLAHVTLLGAFVLLPAAVKPKVVEAPALRLPL